jgi:hypothetical protein
VKEAAVPAKEIDLAIQRKTQCMAAPVRHTFALPEAVTEEEEGTEEGGTVQ